MFEHRTLAHGLEALIVVDPTSNQAKNASISCFKIRDVLALFKTISDKLTLAKSLISTKFDEFIAEKVRLEGAEALTDPTTDNFSAQHIMAALGLPHPPTDLKSDHRDRKFLEGVLGLVDYSAGQTALFDD